MNIFFSRNYVVERAFARGFESLGYKAICKKSCHKSFISNIKAFDADVIISTNNGYIPSAELVSQAKKYKPSIKCFYWERRARKFLKSCYYSIFDAVFTVYNDKSAILLPCAAEDHIALKTNVTNDLTLVAKYKVNSGSPRGDLHRWVNKELGFGNYTLVNKIPASQYDTRFNYMANSWASIGVWNESLAVPLRYFEIISCNTPLFSYPYPEFENYFIPKEHYISTKALKKSVAYCREHPDEMNKVSLAAHKHLLANHTYAHRARKVLEYV